MGLNRGYGAERSQHASGMDDLATQAFLHHLVNS